MGAVALDANVVIGFLEPTDAHHERARKELGARTEQHADLLLAASAYAEVLVRPLVRGVEPMVDEFLDAASIAVVAVDAPLARRAAELRARHRSLRLGDALVLAVALTHDAELLTFDERLRRVARGMR